MFHPDWLILRILHQSFEIERPKGHWSEVVVYLYKRYKIFNGQEWKKITRYRSNLSYFIPFIFIFLILIFSIRSRIKGKGAQWLSGRVLDSRPKGRGFEPHRRHCVVVLEQDTFILA